MKNYIGMRSGRLVVEKFHHKTETGHQYYICKCDCGKKVVVRASHIQQKTTRSCGCLIKDATKEKNTKHGMWGTRIYRIWRLIKSRCENKNNNKYIYYGGRGINVCEMWKDFKNFYKWAKSNGYSDELTIDRIDVNGDYCPNNCRWADKYTQARNKRNNDVIEYKNESHCISEWAEILGCKTNTLYTRKRKGYPVEEILFHKKRKHFFKRNQQHIKNI